MKERVTQRFLKYVAVDTQSDEASDTFPSTEKQKVLAKMLVEELRPSGVIPPPAFLQVPSAFLYSEMCLKPHRTAYLLPHILKNAA